MATIKPAQDAPILADLEAEEAVLGSLLLDPTCIVLIADFLRPGDFYREKHNWVYEADVALYERHGSIDVVTLCDELERMGKLADAGGPAFVTWLMNQVPTAAHVEHYARIVARIAGLRRLVTAASETVARAYKPDADPQAVWQAGRDALDSAVGQRADKAALDLQDSLTAYYDVLGERQEARDKPIMRLPWQSLTWYVPRIPGGTVTVIGAPSSVGKTTFMENCAEEWTEQGFNIIFFHFELSHAVMLDRRMARQAGVAIDRLWSGRLTDDEAGAVAEATDRISSWPGNLTLVHCPGWPMPRVALKVRQLATRQRVDAVVVDYLQKSAFHQYERGLTPAQMRGQDVETLKILAEELDLRVMLGSQMNREAQGVAHKTRHQLRDTGEADEKGNIVLILDREIRDTDLFDVAGNKTARAGDYSPEVKCRIDKNTLGKTGQAVLILDGPRFRLGDVVR